MYRSYSPAAKITEKTWKHDSILPCINGSGWWCNGVGDIFLANLGPLVPTEYVLTSSAYLSIVADCVHPCMTALDPSSDGYFQQDNAPCLKTPIISNWFLEHDNEFTELQQPQTPQSPDLSPKGHLWDVVEILVMDVHLTNLQQLSSCSCCHQNLWGIFPTPYWIYDTKN